MKQRLKRLVAMVLMGMSLSASAITLEGIALKGNFSVLPTGSASYSVPIDLPKGPGSFTPSLSLLYNSQQGNSFLGQGWSIGGLSSISRCPLTIAQDGRNRSVALDDQDGLCLDGVRLIYVKDGTAISGYSVKEYSTEIETFNHVVAYIPTGQSFPEYFKVWRKNGLIETYGTTADSRIEVGQSSSIVKEWGLNRREDRRGNYMDVGYTENQVDGEVLPAFVDYGANSAVGQAHLYRVTFVAESRTDKLITYQLGYKKTRLSRLNSITIKKLNNGVVGNTVRTYTLGYEYSQSTGASRLKTVDLCAQEGGAQECIPTTTFTWHQLSNSFLPKVSAGMPPYSMTVATDTQYSTIGGYKGGMLADLDNDGRPDYVHSSGAANKNIFMLNQGGSQFTTETASGATKFAIASGGKDGGLRVVDINHDGYMDLVQVINGVIDVKCGGKDQSGFHFSPCTAIPSGQTAAQAYLSIAGDFVDGANDGGLRLADINDDGIDDFILLQKKNSVSTRKVYIGSYRTDISGSSKYYYWYEDATLSAALPQDAYFVNEGKDEGLRIFDIDGNGRPDLVFSPFSGNKAVYLNQWASSVNDNRTSPAKMIPGAAFASDSVYAASLPLPFVSDTGGDAGVRFVDLNGDGLIDIIRAHSDTSGRPTGVYRAAYFNTGKAYLSNDATFANSINVDINMLGVDGGVRFADVNGDGLVDAVESQYTMYSGTNAPKVNVYLSNGASFIRSASYSASISDLYIQLNGSDVCSHDGSGPCSGFYWLVAGTELVDIDGDGYIDLVQLNNMGATGNGAPYPYSAYSTQRRYQLQSRGDGVSNDKLASICDGLSHCTSIKYSPVTNSSVYTPAFDAALPKRNINGPLHVVSQVEETADNGSSSPQVTQYKYKGLLFSTDGRGLLGFAEQTITVRMPNSLTGQYETRKEVTTQYNQEWPYVGTVSSVSTRAGNNGVLIGQVSNTYGLKSCAAGVYNCAEETQITVQQQDITRRYLPYLKQSIEQGYDFPAGTLMTSSTKTTTLDGFGNVDLEEVQIAEGENTYTSTNDPDYAPSDTVKWLLSQTTRVTTSHQQPDFDGDGSNDLQVRTTDFNYYPASSSNNFEGLPKQKIIEPNDTTTKLRQTAEYAYDAYGNVISTTLTGALFSFLVPRVSQQDFAGTNGRYPTSLTNAKGFIESRDFHPETGAILHITDVNNVRTTWTYDLFGREKTGSGPDDLDTTVVEGLTSSTVYSSCANDCLPNTRYIKTISAPGEAEVVSYYDSSSRVVGTRTKSLSGGYSYIEFAYNADGTLWKKSRPYFPGETKYWTIFEYDALRRPTKVTDPNGYVTTVTYAGFETSTTNPKLQVHKEKKNALGQLVQVTDAAAKNMVYAYDAFGNLTLTRDAKGNEVKIKYDLLGRKKEVRDPDLGLWTYVYNAYGELTSQTDTRGISTTLDYDVLGRLKSKSVPGTQVSTWTYDELTVSGVATPVPNGKGRLITASADNGYLRDYAHVQAGVVTGGYDSYGHPLLITTTIDNAAYALAYDYDSNGRVAVLHYPGGVDYKNVYTNGYLNKVTNSTGSLVYWEAKQLNAAGQVTEEKLGNGLTTKRSFKPGTGLIESIRTGLQGVNGLSATVQNEYYDYDSLNSLWFRYDGISGVSESFGYDNLNRLTSSQVDGLAAVSITYDEIGNITSKSDVGTLYSYNSSGSGSIRPHAVIATSGGPISTTFDYDTNGNMLSGNGRSYVDLQGQPGWNGFNKPISIIRGNVTETFLYDAEFERAKRTTRIANGGSYAESSIIYLNPRLDLGGTYEREAKADNSVEHTYHLYAGPQAIGTIVVKEGGNPTTETRYFHMDGLGSITDTTSDTGTLLEHLSYDSWGMRRLLSSAQTPLGNSSSLTLPSTLSDPNHLVTRDATSGYITFKTNGIRRSQPYAQGQSISAQLQHTVQTVLQLGSNRAGRRNFELAIENTASIGTSVYRRYGVILRKGQLLRHSCIGTDPCTDVVLGALVDNAQYTLSITTTGLAAQLSIQQQGVSGSFADAMTIDWGAGVSGMQKRVIAGLADKVQSLIVPPLILRAPNAQVVMQSLTQAAVSPQDGSIVAATTRHGYTGHEMLDSIQLIHMNGRLYDAQVGRFLSADPNVFYPKNMQDYNRYAYVQNSPLNFADPSGYAPEGFVQDGTTTYTCCDDGPAVTYVAPTGHNPADPTMTYVSAGTPVTYIPEYVNNMMYSSFMSSVGQAAVGTPENFSSPHAEMTEISIMNASTDQAGMASGNHFDFGPGLDAAGIVTFALGTGAGVTQYAMVLDGWGVKAGEERWRSFITGKSYDFSFHGNQWTAGRTWAQRIASDAEIFGKGAFYIDVILQGGQATYSVWKGDYQGATLNGVSMAIGYFGLKGGLPGLAMGVAYGGMSLALKNDAVYSCLITDPLDWWMRPEYMAREALE